MTDRDAGIQWPKGCRDNSSLREVKITSGRNERVSGTDQLVSVKHETSL